MELLSEGPKTPDEVARRLGIAWATAHGRLLRLAGEGRVGLVRKGRVNVFYLASPGKLVFRIPAWVRSRKLRELARELEQYFEGQQALGIIQRQRRVER